MALFSAAVDLSLAGAPPLPLTQAELRANTQAAILRSADTLFPKAVQPHAALAGFLLRLGHWSESHQAAQDIPTIEGSYWHAILHRMEPDPSNAAYWFRRVGSHPIFPELHRQAQQILLAHPRTDWRLRPHWDSSLFIEWCDDAVKNRGELESAARAIQMAEWKLLIDWCAEPTE